MLEKMEGVIKHSKSKDWQHQANKTQDEDKQDTGRRQTRHRTKTNKTQDEDKQDTGRRQTKHNKQNKSKTQYNTKNLKDE